VRDSRSCASASSTTLRDRHHETRGRARNWGQIPDPRSHFRVSWPALGITPSGHVQHTAQNGQSHPPLGRALHGLGITREQFSAIATPYHIEEAGTEIAVVSTARLWTPSGWPLALVTERVHAQFLAAHPPPWPIPETSAEQPEVATTTARAWPIPDPWDWPAFLASVEQARGRPLLLKPAELDPDDPSVWIATSDTDIIVYHCDADPAQQVREIAYEAAHILLGHRPVTADTSPLFPHLDPAAVEAALASSRYSDADEQAARDFASRVVALARAAVQPEQQ
jgi:hypothetical protein